MTSDPSSRIKARGGAGRLSPEAAPAVIAIPVLEGAPTLKDAGRGEGPRGNADLMRWGVPGRSDILAIVSWTAVIAVILMHAAASSRAGSLYWMYQNAGRAWLAGNDLYRYRHFAVDQGSFIYSPLAAALFVPFALLGNALSNVLWRLLSVTLLLSGVWRWLEVGFHDRISRPKYAAIFLLLIPFAIGNIKSGQVNLLVVSLVMFAFVDANLRRWGVSTLCVALAAYYKIYPLAAGLLLALMFPRQFSWRLVLALVALGCVPFLLQRPAYVLQQYGHWILNRARDDRQMAPMRMAPRDLMLLLRMLRCPVSPRVYLAIQLLGGLGIAALCVSGRLKKWGERRLMVGLFSLVCCWMVLLGPATESATYVLLAPALVLALVHGLALPMTIGMRCALMIAFALLLSALGFSCFGEFNHFPFNAFQPLGALIFAGYMVAWLMDDALWNRTAEG